MGETALLPAELRTELIKGEIIDMSPINSLHAAAVKRLNRLLSRVLGDTVLLSVQDPIAISEYSEPQPDIAVLNFRADFYAEGHPQPEDILLVVEVADSSVYKDRNVKIPMYGNAGIPEVWLVDLEHNSVEIHLSPFSEGYKNCQVYKKGDTITSPCVKSVAVDELLGL